MIHGCDHEKCERIRAMYNSGYSINYIAEKVHRDPSQIRDILRNTED